MVYVYVVLYGCCDTLSDGGYFMCKTHLYVVHYVKCISHDPGHVVSTATVKYLI